MMSRSTVVLGKFFKKEGVKGKNEQLYMCP